MEKERVLKDEKDKMELEKKQFEVQIQDQIKEKLSKDFEVKYDLIIKEKEKQLEDQKKLAEEVTAFIHGMPELEKAIQTTEKLFSGNAVENIRDLDEAELLQSLEGVPVFNYHISGFESGVDLVSLLSETGIFPSKGEARKMVTGGGISINKEKMCDANAHLNSSFLLHGKYVLVQKGKKNYYLIVIR